MGRVYFVSDVHLGLDVSDPADREARFVSFLRSIPTSETQALYLLGDIWDFWYEYRHVVPKGYVQVFSAIQDLISNGVEVFFCPGNHDIWTYHYFEELGMKKIQQPYAITLDGKRFCLGHGDGLGMGPCLYRFMNKAFKSKVLQFFFSMLHPRMAFGMGNGWSKNNRLARAEKYHFKGSQEPLYKWCVDYASAHRTDYFIFGHFHDSVNLTLPGGEHLMILDSWMDSSSYLYWDGMYVRSGHLPNSER